MPTFVQYTHVEPAIMARLAGAVAPDPLLVHVDAKVDIETFRVAAAGHPNVSFLADRVVVNWAGWSQVKAIRRLVRDALAVTADDDHVVLLSGQDYPIRPLPELRAMLAASNGTQFARYFLVDEANTHYWEHFGRRHYRDLPLLRRGAKKAKLRKIRNAIIRGLESGPTGGGMPPPPAGVAPAHGGTHFAMTAGCLRELESKVTPEHEHWFARVFCPEEHFYQSLLATSSFRDATPSGGPEDFAGRGNWRYQNLHHIHPSLRKVYTLDDWDEVASSGQWFLRKVESGRSADLLDRIDAELLERPSRHPAD